MRDVLAFAPASSVASFESAVLSFIGILALVAIQVVALVLLVRWMVRMLKTAEGIARATYEMRDNVRQLKTDAAAVSRQLTQ